MFRRMGYGIELAKQSFRVLRLDKELLLFPIFSAIACLLVSASFIAPLVAGGFFDNLAGDDPGAIMYLVVFGFYVANYFVIIFFNAAVVECAIIRFRGGDPTVADGLKGASGRLPQIFGWAVVAATVGIILRAIEERSGLVGRIVSGLLGLAWSAATFFVVPIIVMERLGPIAAAKRSTRIVRQTWREAVGAHLGIGAISFLLYIVCGAVIALGMAMMSTPIVGGTLAVAGLLGMLAVALCSSVVSAIVTGALYMYAGQGQVPDHFERETLDRVFS